MVVKAEFRCLVLLACNNNLFVLVIRTMLQFYAEIIPPILCTASGQRYFYFLPKRACKYDRNGQGIYK